MMAWVSAGYTVSELRAFASRVIDEVALASRLHPEMLPILRWASQQKFPALCGFSFSGRSHSYRLGESRSLRGRGLGHVTRGDRWKGFAPRCRSPLTYGPGKTAALRASASNKRLIGAFGDSAFDFPMLAAAVVPVMVRPKAELVHRAHGRCVLAIFELRPAALEDPLPEPREP